MLSDEIQIRIHFWLATPTSLIFVKQITLNSELSNFDNVSILQSSRCCGLSISVLWTMIIHARFLIKTCHHASHFYALNKHNYLCICLEIFLSKCKPLARVDPIINRPLTNWCESPCKKSIFDVGITKIKWVEELSDMGKRLNIVLFFVCLHFCCSNEQFLALIKQKSISNTLLSFVLHSPVIPQFALTEWACHFSRLYNSVLNDTGTLIGCFKMTISQHQAASLFFHHNTVFHRNPLLTSRSWIPWVFLFFF